MEELNFKLEVFEGPLDLMLSLIQKHKLNIRDIEISVLLEQFLDYLDKMQQADIEVAGEFMEMAAHLILIKSSALLPRHEAEQLKKELEGALIEYAMCKAVAEKLKTMWAGSEIFVREPLNIPIDSSYRLNHDVYELYNAVSCMTDRVRIARFNSRPLSLKPIVAKSYVSVFSKVVYVLKRIRQIGSIEVNSLYKGQNRSEQVATFLALLELSKHGRISFSEDNRLLEYAGKAPVA
ncbi:MAG: segregation/condensation protein A [Firmicutes bacterium]|nr:segregation/condensation protein A [Bacillota bacterium]